MNCPKCDAAALRPVAGEHRCPDCSGFWVARDAVPSIHRTGVLADLDAVTTDATGDARTGLCPEGHGMMVRAKAAWKDPFYLERCPACGGVWLDAGEWTRLGEARLLENLDELWLTGWRHRLQDDEQAARFEADLREKLGDDLYDRVTQLGADIAAHEHGDVALAYLRELVRRF